MALAERMALLEIEPAMIKAGRELVPDATWIEGDVTNARGPADLVVASYVLGELRRPSSGFGRRQPT